MSEPVRPDVETIEKACGLFRDESGKIGNVLSLCQWILHIERQLAERDAERVCLARCYDPNCDEYHFEDQKTAILGARQIIDKVQELAVYQGRDPESSLHDCCDDAMGEIELLKEKLAERDAEVVRLNKLLSGDVKFLEMFVSETEMHLDVKHFGVMVLAASLAKTLADSENCVTMELKHDETPMVVTVQRKWGKSPAQMINELRAEIEALKTQASESPHRPHGEM